MMRFLLQPILVISVRKVKRWHMKLTCVERKRLKEDVEGIAMPQIKAREPNRDIGVMMSSELVWFGFPSVITHGDYQERCFPQSLPITFVSHLEKAFLDSTNIMASSVCFLFYSFSSNDFLLKQRLPTFFTGDNLLFSGSGRLGDLLWKLCGSKLPGTPPDKIFWGSKRGVAAQQLLCRVPVQWETTLGRVEDFSHGTLDFGQLVKIYWKHR